MKVYVDELPKSCWDCPCHKGDNGLCKLLQEYTDYVPKTCPLQSLTDYTKQVRKEVLGDLKEELKKNGKCSIRATGTMDFFVEMDKLNEILDQIQGE